MEILNLSHGPIFYFEKFRDKNPFSQRIKVVFFVHLRIVHVSVIHDTWNRKDRYVQRKLKVVPFSSSLFISGLGSIVKTFIWDSFYFPQCFRKSGRELAKTYYVCLLMGPYKLLSFLDEKVGRLCLKPPLN